MLDDELAIFEPQTDEFCSRNKSIRGLKTLRALVNPLAIIHQWISSGSDT
jgi:hypothetical protein